MKAKTAPSARKRSPSACRWESIRGKATIRFAKGRSSVGRALVSKTRCRRFESCRPCWCACGGSEASGRSAIFTLGAARDRLPRRLISVSEDGETHNRSTKGNGLRCPWVRPATSRPSICSRRSLVVHGRVVGAAALPGRAHSPPPLPPWTAGVCAFPQTPSLADARPRPRGRPGSRARRNAAEARLLCEVSVSAAKYGTGLCRMQRTPRSTAASQTATRLDAERRSRTRLSASTHLRSNFSSASWRSKAIARSCTQASR